MPTKLKPSVIKIDRNTKQKTVEHFYMKTMPQAELFELLNKDMTKPKVKQKIRNELTRRGVKIVWVRKDS